MKATVSKDGHRRFTIRTEFRIGRDEMISMLVNNIEEWPNTKWKMKQLIVDILQSYGANWSMRRDSDLTQEEFNGIEAEAALLVDRLFPEFRKENV